MGEDLEFLIEVGDNAQASILRAYLEQHGVYCYVQGENHRSMLGMVGAYIALRLMVPSSQLDDARTLLEQYELAEPEGGAEFRGPFRDEEEDDAGDEALALDMAREVRAVRIASIMVPVGGGHFRAKAPVRGVILAGLVGLFAYQAVTATPLALLGWPVIVLLDYLAAPAVVRERHRT